MKRMPPQAPLMGSSVACAQAAQRPRRFLPLVFVGAPSLLLGAFIQVSCSGASPAPPSEPQGDEIETLPASERPGSRDSIPQPSSSGSSGDSTLTERSAGNVPPASDAPLHGFVKFTPADRAYEILLPPNPTESFVGPITRTVTGTAGDSLFTIVESIADHTLVAGDVFESVKAGYVEKGWKLGTEKLLKHDGRDALRLTYTTAKQVALTLLVIPIGKRLYQLMAGEATDTQADAFFATFKSRSTEGRSER